jgi:tetratricopeptide (TPR) repeat protein
LLGQEYLRQRGNKAFLSDASPVPFVVNNDGALSRNAAEVFFTSLVAADQRGQLEEEIFVLELGIGVGLFARYFLDHVRHLAREHQTDYYERLCYIAADRSERMLNDVLRHGLLADHPGRYRVRRVDAMKPEELLPFDIGFRGVKGKPFRAVFLNYLLDCLPAAVLELDGEQVRQLCVRTCVARNVRLAEYTDLTPEQLRERAESLAPRSQAGDVQPPHPNPSPPKRGRGASEAPASRISPLIDGAVARDELLEVYGLFASEYDYRPVDGRSLPYGEFAVEYGRKQTKRLLHSYGAIQCLEKLLGLVADGGFVLVNDYGQTQTSRDDEFEHQRFSLATFVGVNFPLLKEYFEGGKRCQYVEPGGEGRGIHSRLLGPRLAYEVVNRFQEQFGEAAYKRLQEPIEKARACAKAGRFELAAGFYREALHLQPRNWVLLCEVSQFLTFSLRDPKAGADMAKVALALNPTCSSELWNALGDALYEFGRTAEARSAYTKALSVNEADVRARYNLAWVETRSADYPAALRWLAKAFALDKTGQYRERLLQKQQEVLQRLALRHQQEYLLLINLVSKYAKEEKDRTEPPEPVRPVVVSGGRESIPLDDRD